MPFNIPLKNRYIFFLFLSLFLVGIYIFKDYGLTIDDEYYRKNGVFYKNFILNYLHHLINFNFNEIRNLYEGIEDNTLRNHPAIFETFLAFLSDLIKLENIYEIYHLSHLLNFTIYIIGLIILYKIIEDRFNNINISILCVLLIFFSPRFFAESFYNSRDIFFFSLFIFFIFSTQKLINYENYKNILLVSLSSALLINAKILGIIPFLIFLTMYSIFISEKKNFKLKDLKTIFALVIFTFLFIVILWPYLWVNPIKNFLTAYKDIINAHNSLSVITFFNGEYISSENTPWFYRIIWFYITTPTIICILFSFGFLNILRKFSLRVLNLEEKNPLLLKNKEDFCDYFLLLSFLGVIFLSIKFNTSQFNGWRHLYFLYFIIIYFVAHLMKSLLHLKNQYLKQIIFFSIFINIVFNIHWIIKNHPYQNNFFNKMFVDYAVSNFDNDYWGLANLNSLKVILKKQPDKIIKISSISFADLKISSLKLNKEDRKRIKITYDIEEADYLINSYMKRPRNNFTIPSDKYQIIYDLKVNKTSINTVYKKLE